jgi:hypothetical protein
MSNSTNTVVYFDWKTAIYIYVCRRFRTQFMLPNSSRRSPINMYFYDGKVSRIDWAYERITLCLHVLIRLFRIISIPSKKKNRPLDHVISLDFRCQCTQQKLQSIYAVLTFYPQLKKILTFSVKDISIKLLFFCIKDFNAETITSLKLNLFSFFICCCQHHERITICLYIFLKSDR